MNKKFLSAILFGALMVSSTGTFVSCKDYDDDIDNLQEQIDKLATKEDMSSQIASLQTALEAAKAEAAKATAAAQEALTKANSIADKATAAEKEAAEAAKKAAQAALDAANAKAEAIKAAQDEVAKVKAELEAAIDAKFEASKNELAKTIAELTKKVEEMTGYTTKMVTSIHFLENQGNTSLDLNYYRIKRFWNNNENKQIDGQQYTFGKGKAGEFTMNVGDVNTVKDNFMVNVLPANAAISSNSISLINGKGESVNEFVNLTIGNVEKYIYTRANSPVGLRQVGVQMKKDADFEAFDDLLIAGRSHSIDGVNCNGDHTYIAYALAVTDGERVANSDFKLKMHVQMEKKATNIGKSWIQSEADTRGAEIWNYQYGYDTTGDWEEQCYPVELAQPFTIEVMSDGGRVMASYVEVDYNNNTLSVADKAALKGIKFTGVDNVKTLDNVHELTLDGEYATGIPVPLKLWTVDYQGNIETIVVWVKAGKPALMDVNFTVTPTSHVADGTNWTVPSAASSFEAFEIPEGTAKFSMNWYVGEESHNEVVDLNDDGDMSVINRRALQLYKADKKTVTTSVKDAKFAQFDGTLNLQIMKENVAYKGVIKFYNAKGTYLGSNNLSVKKVLPTAIPEGLTAKTGVIHADGSMPIYPKPMAGGTPANGQFDLKEAFLFSDALYTDAYLTFSTPSFDQIANYSANNRVITNIKKEVIGKDTKYATKVTYNYGDIQYHPEGHGVEAPEEVKIEWTTKFDIVLGCYVQDSKFAWVEEPTVVFSKDVTIDPIVNKVHVDFMTAKNPYGVEIDPFSSDASVIGWATWAPSLANPTIELWSNGDKNRVNEFFTAKVVYNNTNKNYTLQLTKNVTATVVPENDVPTTVVFKLTDKFGHQEYVKALTFTMKKNAEK